MKSLKDNGLVEYVGQKGVHSATIEEALNMTGFGKYNYGLLLICSWTLQAMGMDMFGTSFTVAAAVCDLELTMQQRSLLTAMPLLGVVAGAQTWGYLADTKGRRQTLIYSMAIGFLFAASSSLSPNWGTMAVLKFLSSTFTSASNSCAYTLLGESCNARARSRSMLLCNCALMCSQACAAVFAYPILPLEFAYPISILGILWRPWRLLVLVIALPCAASAGLLILFHESPKFLASRGRYDEALNVLRNIYAINTGDKEDNFPVQKLLMIDDSHGTKEETKLLKAVWNQTAPLFRRPFLKTTLQLFYLVIVIYMTGSGFIMWLPYIMNNLFSSLEAGLGDGMNLCSVIRMSSSVYINTTALEETSTMCDDTIQDTTLLTAMSYGALCSTVNLVLSLSWSHKKRSVSIGILGITAVSAIVLNLVHIPLAGAAIFFIFLMSALTMGILSVYFVELYPTSLRGMASCLSVMVGRASAFVGVNIIGSVLTHHCEATFYFWAIFVFSGLIFAWYLPKDNPQT